MGTGSDRSGRGRRAAVAKPSFFQCRGGVEEERTVSRGSPPHNGHRLGVSWGAETPQEIFSRGRLGIIISEGLFNSYFLRTVNS